MRIPESSNSEGQKDNQWLLAAGNRKRGIGQLAFHGCGVSIWEDEVLETDDSGAYVTM